LIRDHRLDLGAAALSGNCSPMCLFTGSDSALGLIS
jgi:hypothetical protein